MQNIIVWGMGNYYKNREAWITNNYNIIAFIHSDPVFCKTYFQGKKVILPIQIKEYNYDFIFIAVKEEEKLRKQLIDLGVSENKIKKINFSSDMVYKDKDSLKLNRKNLSLFYYDYPNIGDILNAFILDKLFQVKVVKSEIQNADMLAIGSILDLLLIENNELAQLEEDNIKNSEIHIWGTGFINNYKSLVSKKLLRPVKIHALRGRMTKNIFSEILGYEIDCILADPGLLVSLLYPSKKKKYEIGIIPHYVENSESIFLKMKNYYKDAIIIDVRDYPVKVLEKISQCKCIISTSLHGLVIADSYGIPNQWCVYSDKIIGNNFKYYDYYSAFNLEIIPYILKENKFPDIDKINRNYSITIENIRKKQKQLISCFPDI